MRDADGSLVHEGGERLRISASLVAADDAASFWTERFEGTLADVFDMQDRVAAAVVDAPWRSAHDAAALP